MNVHQALARLAETDLGFGWVFVDPPYASEESRRVLEMLGTSRLLGLGAVIVVEHDKRHLPPEVAGALHLGDRRFYGDTGVSFFRRDTSLA
jgi:16S rRNA G966 N2-methylase RsmD